MEHMEDKEDFIRESGVYLRGLQKGWEGADWVRHHLNERYGADVLAEFMRRALGLDGADRGRR